MVKYIHICQNGIYGVAQGARALNIWNHLFFLQSLWRTAIVLFEVELIINDC